MFAPPRLPQLRTIFAEPVLLLGRPIQLSVQVFCGDFACLSQCCTTFWSRSLFSFDTDSKRLETTVFTIHVRTSFLDGGPACNRIVIRRQFPQASPEWTEFQQSGNCACCRVLACCLMLRNVEVNWGPRKRRLSRRTLAGNSCFWAEGWSACARYRHRCRTWAHNLCLEIGSARWPDGPSQSGVAQGGLVWFPSAA